jgi:hypothetical protein
MKQLRLILILAALVGVLMTPAAPQQDPDLQSTLLKQQARERINAFQQLLRAAGPNADASWELVGVQLWSTLTRRPLQGVLLIRVDSDNPAQILLTSMLIARDIIGAGIVDQINVRAIGKWYGPEVEHMLDSVVELNHSIRRFDRDSWRMSITHRVPTDRELMVIKTWKALAPPAYFESRKGVIVEYDHARDEMREQTDSRVASALNMTAEEVKKTLLDIRRHVGVRVNVATDAGCIRSDPSLTCIDQGSLKRQDGFPDAVQVIDDVCRNVSPTMHGNVPIACEFGRPYF